MPPPHSAMCSHTLTAFKSGRQATSVARYVVITWVNLRWQGKGGTASTEPSRTQYAEDPKRASGLTPVPSDAPVTSRYAGGHILLRSSTKIKSKVA